MDSKSWGRVFREIREMKNLSLAKVAGDYEDSPNFITSKVQLSRFERGESDITLGKIVPLVKNLGITFEEYLAHIRSFDQSEQSLFIEKLEHQSELENFGEVEKLYQSAAQNFEKLGEPFYHWSALEAKAILASHQIKNYQLTEQEIQEVADYLFSIEEWDKSEIFLFGELLDFLNERLVYEFTVEVFHRNNYYQKNPRNREYVILLLKSVIVYFIDRKNKEKASIFLEDYRKLINSPIIDIHNQKEFMTLEGLYYFMIGESDKGKMIFNNLSKAYKALGYNDLSEYMKKIIKEKTKNRNK